MTTSAPRTTPEKHDRIVEAAARRFRYYGIAKTTMQEIAQDAGLAVGTLYLYFANKDALVAACAEKFAERHRRQAAEILAGNRPPAEKLRAYVVARFRQADETRTASPHAAEITRAVLRVKPDRIRQEVQMMLEVFERILREGIAAGVFQTATPEMDAEVFLFSLAAFFPSALAEPQQVPLERDLLKIIDWFLAHWMAGPRSKAPQRKRRASPTRTRR